jgi:hypothetical protein
MAKKEKTTAPKAPDQPSSNIRSYFTKEINDQIVDMSVKEMESLMKEIIGSRFWIALLKYTSMRTPLLDSVLRQTSPVEDPHKISWSQGCMAGLCDIETYIIDLNFPTPQVSSEPLEGEPASGNPEGVIIG